MFVLGLETVLVVEEKLDDEELDEEELDVEEVDEEEVDGEEVVEEEVDGEEVFEEEVDEEEVDGEEVVEEEVVEEELDVEELDVEEVDEEEVDEEEVDEEELDGEELVEGAEYDDSAVGMSEEVSELKSALVDRVVVATSKGTVPVDTTLEASTLEELVLNNRAVDELVLIPSDVEVELSKDCEVDNVLVTVPVVVEENTELLVIE
ncbi:hypothetical protein MMC24_004536 [Lignoscripta atroalba]|nr:hypothetical protein [Lignoscripta atroalba]